MRTRAVFVLFFLCLAGAPAPAQQDTTWQPWSWLLGEWVGEGSGSPGEGGGWFTLTPELDGRVLVRKNHAEYPASGNRPRVVHNDLLIVYRDSSKGPAKAVYFDNEGHVITYGVTTSDRAIVLTSAKAGDAPIFRLTYSRLEGDLIDVAFEMSRDGERFMTYLQGKCRRRK
jgi:hypothetical protein